MSTSQAVELKLQTWVLKVLMHCGGCQKKVKKVLHSIDGVYVTDVDSQQHKVTVTGSVDAETVMKKLEKAGKHAEPWPEIPAEKEAKLDGKLKQKNPKSEENGSSGVGDPKNNSVEKSADAAKMGGGGDVREVGDKNGGSKKKKNGLKGGCSCDCDNKNSINGRASSIGSPPPAADSTHSSAPQPQPQPQLVYQYPPMYHLPSAYALNYYSMAPPTTGSSYNPVPPAFANMHTSAKTYPHASPDLYNEFGDEEDECGPCGCSVM